MSVNWLEDAASGPVVKLDLALAVALSCAENGCQAAFVAGGPPVSADYAPPLIAHGIRVEPGQLIVVDRSTMPLQVIYRWDDVEVRQDGSEVVLFQDGAPIEAAALSAPVFAWIAQRRQPKQSPLPFNALLLLDRFQLEMLPGWLPEAALARALAANSTVEWYLRHKCPDLQDWLDGVMAQVDSEDCPAPEQVRQAENEILVTIEDLLVYVTVPEAYDRQPFMSWDDRELTSVVDFSGKTVIDIGSGTGRLALIAAQTATAVYAVEPVSNLRRYIKDQARAQGYRNVYVVDGLIADLPFADGFADVTIEGHVFGDYLQAEHDEMVRVTKTGGMIVHCPGNADRDSERHDFLLAQGFQWSRFKEPKQGWVRKYWKKV